MSMTGAILPGESLGLPRGLGSIQDLLLPGLRKHPLMQLLALAFGGGDKDRGGFGGNVICVEHCRCHERTLEKRQARKWDPEL